MSPKEIANQNLANTIIKNMAKKNLEGYYCATSAEAVEKALSLMPEGASVTWGGSMTLTECGLMDALRTANYEIIDRDTAKTPEEAKNPDESTIYQLYKHFASESEIAEFAEMFRAGGMGYGTAKTILFEKINSVLAEPRAKYEYLMSNTAEIEAILADGAKRAGAVARETLGRVKKAMLG